MLQEHMMPWKTHVFYFVLTATLTSIKLINGRTADAGAVLQRRAETISAHSPRFGTVQGSLHFRSAVSDVKHESAAPTRDGSLAFRFDNQTTTVLHRSMDAKLKRMDPSVQCGDNLMTLKIKRARAPHVLVDSGEGPLIPLSQMPSSCGFSVKRSRRDVLFAAPYKGCHVTRQGGDYALPLRLWGAPMTMSCPVVSPLPSISCFPSGMVLKINGITANELKVKVSGTWKSLSSVCSSCGFAVEVLSEGLTLTAPYHRGLCIEMKDEEYLLSLLLADVELLVTCPSLPSVKPTTATTTSSSDGGQFLQYPLYPQFPIFPQYPVFPGPSPQTQSPTAPTDAPAPQYPQLPSGAAAGSGPGTENQEVPAAQHPAFPFMPQYSQLPQYPLFPRPVPPTQSTSNENTAAPPAQLPQILQSPQYLFPFSPQFPMVPGIFHPTTPPPPPPPPPATSTEVLVTTPAHTEHDGKPNFHQQPQFPVLPPYPFLPFPKRPVPPEDQPQTGQDPKPVLQQPKPHVYPQTYQIPVLYPPQRQSAQSQTAAPATTSTTTATTTLKPAIQKPFYYPYPYMPLYYAPQQPPVPVFPDQPTTPPTPASADKNKQRTMLPFYPFRNW